jgi:GT2 family glycosyltransferase
MSDTPLVTCVIVAYHRPEPLARLLDGLRDPGIEVVVVNVDGDPDVAVVAGERAVPLVGNPGYAAAVNAGARTACGPVVVFLNDDVEVEAGAVLSLAATVSSKEADVALPCVLDGTGRREPTIAPLASPRTLFREWFLLPDRPPALLRGRITGVQKWRAPVSPERVDAAAATVVAVSASLLRRIPLPEEYFLYWEESDWFWRLKAAGARVLYDPGVTVRHAGGRDDVRPAKSRLLARNAVRCVRRTQGRPAALLAGPVVVLWNFRLVAADGLRSLAGSRPAAARLPARAGGLVAALLAWREL